VLKELLFSTNSAQCVMQHRDTH